MAFSICLSLSFFFLFGTQGRLRYTFLKNSNQSFQKGTGISIVLLKLFEYPLIKFNNFKPPFHKFFYSGVFWFKFCSFLLARNLIWKYFSLDSIWNFMYTYIYMYGYVLGARKIEGVLGAKIFNSDSAHIYRWTSELRPWLPMLIY